MIVILSQDAELYSTKVLVEAFQAEGYEVLVLDALALEVKVGRGVYFKGDRIEPSYVVPRLSSALMLAGSAVLREWERMGVPSLNSSQGIGIANDQLHTLQVLSQYGIKTPETSFCSQPQGDATYSSVLGGGKPKVIKLLHSSQGKGVTYAADLRTGMSLLSTLSSLKSSGVTQTFYKEAKGVDVRIIVLFGKVVQAIRRVSKDGDFRANMHQGATCERYTPSLSECKVSIEVSKGMNLQCIGIDWIHTEEGALILEVNASPGLQGAELGRRGSIAREIVSEIGKDLLRRMQ